MPAFAAAFPILFAVLMSFASTVIGVGLQLAFKKKQPNRVTVENRTVTVRQPVQPWQIVYGSARVGGTIIFLERDGSDVWLGVVWAAHEIKAIDSIYTDDTQNFFDNGGNVSGTNASILNIYNHLGDADQTYDTTLAATFPLKWTSDHRLRGRAYTIFKFVNLATNWNNSIPNVSADIRGKLITDSRTGTEVFTDNAGQCIRDFLMNGDFGFGEPVRSIDAANFNIESTLCDEEVEVPNWSEHFTVKSMVFTVNTAGTTNQIQCAAGTVDSDFGGKGDLCYVSSTGTLPAPLVAGTAYYWGWGTAAGNITADLHTNEADALAGTNPIDITTGGTGTRTIVNMTRGFEMVGRETTFTADTGTDEITLANPFSGTFNGFSYVWVFESTTTLPAPLVAGTRYTNRSSGAPVTTLQTYPASGGLVNLTTTGTGTHTVRLLAITALTTAVDPVNDTISIELSNICPGYIGQQVTLRLDTGAVAPDPLVDGGTYYVLAGTSVANLRVAASRSDAEVGKYIDITSSGSGTIYLESSELGQTELLGATTGTIVRVDIGIGGGTLPTGLSTGTDYYLIRRGRGQFQLASTLQNALDGIAVAATDTGTNSYLTYRITWKRERRYTINGAFDADQDKREVLKGMANAIGMGAILEPLGTGKWRMKQGRYQLPVGSLGLAQVRSGGVPEISTRIERRSAANTIKGIYNSPLNFDQASDFPAVSDPRYVAADGGEELVEDITLPYTNSKTMARRIATSWLKRKRQQRSIRFPATLAAGFRYEYGDSVAVTLPLLGYVSKVFQVQGWEMTTESDGTAPPIPRVDLVLREMNPQAFQ